jgi:hypothetical protein
MQQRPAETDKARHKAKPKNHEISRASTREAAARRNVQQGGANAVLSASPETSSI